MERRPPDKLSKLDDKMLEFAGERSGGREGGEELPVVVRNLRFA